MRICFILLILSIFLITGCSDNLWFGEEKKLNLKGERLKIISKFDDLVIDHKSSKLPLNIPLPVKNDKWEFSNGVDPKTPSNLYLNENINKISLFKIDVHDNFLISGTPIYFNDSVVAMGADGVISCYDLSKKDFKWRNSYFEEIANKGFFSGFDEEYLSGGYSYKSGKIFATSGASAVLAINSDDGAILWAKKVSGPVRSTPIIAKNNLVIVQTTDNKTFALNSDTGNIIWTHLGIPVDINPLRTFEPAIFDNKIIVQYSSGEIYCLSVEDGDEIWSESVATSLEENILGSQHNDIINSPVIDSKYVYTHGHDGMLAVFELHTGQTKWKKHLQISHQFWLSSDLLIAITKNSQLVAINKNDGSIRWIEKLENSKDGKSIEWTSPVVANSKVMVLSSKGELNFHSLHNGNKIKSTFIDTEVYLSPIIAKGRMITLDKNGQINMY